MYYHGYKIEAQYLPGDNFRVLKDGSGGIRSDNVSGEIQVPRDG